MNTQQKSLWCISLLLAFAVMPVPSIAEQKTLSGEALKTLITGKTVSVTHKQSGKQWKMYFGADGKTADSKGGSDTWEVNANGEHCNTFAKLKCAKVADMGDGTYARLTPNGDIAVIWTKIEDGKHL